MNMEHWEIKQLAENTFDDLLNEFWDSANEIAHQQLPNDIQRDEFYSLLWDLLSNYK